MSAKQLMQEAIMGQNPDYESASVLLGRIRAEKQCQAMNLMALELAAL